MANEYFKELGSFHAAKEQTSSFVIRVDMVDGTRVTSRSIPFDDNSLSIVLEAIEAIENGHALFIWSNETGIGMSGCLVNIMANQIKKVELGFHRS